MKELKQCCLHHIFGGNGSKPKYQGNCCEECYNAGIEDENGNLINNRISRDSFSTLVGDVGGVLVGLATGFSGLGTIPSTAISYGASKGFQVMGGYIYDNPEAARHPDYP